MKRNSRPFIVEIKNRRRRPVRNQSIWSDVDLSAVAAEAMTNEVGVAALALVDTKAAHVDVEEVHQPLAERSMADIKEVDPVQSATNEAGSEQATDKGKKAPRARKSKPEAKQSPTTQAKATAVQSASSEPIKTRRRIYSDKERAQKLQQIEAAIAGGKSSKDAVAQAGISEQTYYHWKKAAAPASESGDLKDLVALEEENERLKKLLAERLRRENAELKRKLGLD